MMMGREEPSGGSEHLAQGAGEHQNPTPQRPLPHTNPRTPSATIDVARAPMRSGPLKAL